MELVSLSLRNWRNIPRLTLDQLDRPLVVLHGPNRTGKSGIFTAIRAALFDDAASSSKDVKAYTTWGSEAAPEVILGFRHAGDEFRVHKRFTRGKEGISRLERRTTTGWTKLADGKQVVSEVPRLLGIDKPEDSLLKLLWLPQGTTTLPTELGAGLRRQFETVLGSLLTDRDHRILEAARARVDDWFTSRGEPKVRTELATVRQELEECEREWQDLNQKRSQTELARVRYRDLDARAAEAHRELAKSRRELDEKKAAFSAQQTRRAAHAQATTQLDLARRHAAAAREAVEQWQATAERHREANQAAETAQTEWQALQETLRQSATTLESLEAHSRKVAERERSSRANLSALSERQRLQELVRHRDRLVAEVEELRESRQDLEQREAEQAALLAPSDSDWTTLEALRRELDLAQLQREAGSAQLSFRAATGITVQFDVDGRPPESRELAAGAEWDTTVATTATVTLPGVGEIRFRQGDPQAHNETRRKEERLRDRLRSLLTPLGLAPDQRDLWDELAQRRGRKAILAARIDQLRKSLARDKGTAASRDPAAELARIEAQLTRLAPPAVDAQAATNAAREPDDLTEAIIRAERTVHSCEQELTLADEAVRAARDEVGTLRSRAREGELLAAQMRATLKAIDEELSRLGTTGDLQAAVVAHDEAVQRAEVQELARRLSSEEERLESDIRELEIAIERQGDRLRQAEGELRNLEGEFRSKLGLHDDLTRVESKKAELSARLLRLEREGLARKLLHARLDDARQTQVGDVTRAISERTLGWAEQLGLGEFRSLAFDAGYLPSGLTRRDVETQIPLTTTAESFGTVEQMALLVRLAAGSALARESRQVAVLDDPLAYADVVKHRRMLDIFSQVVRGTADGSAGLQLIVLTCHPERFDRLPSDVPVIDLADSLRRSLAEA